MGAPNNYNLIFLAILAISAAPSLSKLVADYRIPVKARVADFDDSASVLAKMTKFKIIGDNKPADVYQFVKQPGGKFLSVLMKINDKSIFVPNPNDAKSAQVGFRRNDLLPQYDPKIIEKGKTTYHHSFKFTKNLNKAHGYLLASLEFPEADGAHIFDIFYGTPFDSKNTAGKVSADANKIKVRDVNFQEIFSVEMTLNEIFNFAVEVDWDKNTLAVLHSTGDKSMTQVVKLAQNVSKNPKAANPAGKCEWHMQIIKEPLPNPADAEKDRGDTPHRGIQEKGINEEILQLRNFVEDTSKDGPTTTPDGPNQGRVNTKGSKEGKGGKKEKKRSIQHIHRKTIHSRN